MKLKKAIIEVMGRDQLKQVCDDFDIADVDRRSREGMAQKVSRMGRARPERLVEYLMEPEVKAVCDLVGESPTGAPKESQWNTAIGQMVTPQKASMQNR